ncbi:hypothetical protein C6P46_003821 [Rhodotorula mucilaginosa]|uniref:Uncharacterized protein n=1 Tax=Rhodotorula mucilaginosa TaxID=5537 RepID=A0A9P7B5Y8_RHOMI|nr:hypothetical protein C6P46_003821 [Rhodotorula mucilaginosa]
MTLLKRSKSLADLFRPRSRSSGRAADAVAVNPHSHSHASQTTASSSSDADSLPATDAYARQANLRSSSSSPTSTRRPPPPPMIRTNTGASNADMSRSGTVEDILTAYYAESPTKSRHTPILPEVQYSQRQQQQSPTRTRGGPPAVGQPLPKRMDSSGSAFQDGDDDYNNDDGEDSIRQVLPTLPHHDTELARARKEAEANKLQAQQLKSSQRSSRSGRPSQNRSKSSNDLDLIDRLDISGLYGGGGFIRHEGPYAAASTKMQGANAPINAFDPSAFSLAPSQPVRRPSKRNVSNGTGSGRSAGAMLGGLDDPASRSLLSPYAAAAMVPTMSTSSTSSAAGGTGGGSSSEVSLGFPARHPDGKGQQLQEIYGVRDAEAWEDYGRARYDDSSAGTGDASGAASGAASRESVLPGGPVSKEDRMQRAQSIWDIEATLKAGKPVGASNAPPPVPVMPQTWGSPSAGSEFSASTSTSPSLSTNNNKPKRSKSLAARFRAGRKNPTNPLSDGDSPGPPGGGGGEDGRHAGTAYESDGARSVPVSPTEDRRGRNEWPLGASVPASMGSNSTAPSNSYPYPSGAVTSPPASSNGHGYGSGPVEQLEIRTHAIKFDESLSSPTLERTSAGMMSRSLTEDGLASPTSASGGGKKGHGLKRLFSTKRKA